MQRPPGDLGEDQIVVAVAVPQEPAVFVLRLAHTAQFCDQHRREWHSAARLFGFRLLEQELRRTACFLAPVEPVEGLLDRRSAKGEVEVLPTDTQHLAHARAREQGEGIEWIER